MIAVISYDYPPNDGGISRLAGKIVSGLAARNIDVAVVTHYARLETASRPRVDTREVSRGFLRREFETFEKLRRIPHDAGILCTIWNPEATLAFLFGRSRFFVMAHGNEVMPYPSGPIFRVKDVLRKVILGRAEKVICNSAYTERLVRSLQPKAKTKVICPAVDSSEFIVDMSKADARDRFGLPQDRKILLSVSRLSAYKGHETVLRALSRLSSGERSSIYYLIVGRGEHMEALKGLVSNLGLEDVVAFFGFAEDAILPLIYRTADVFILCTREEVLRRGVEGFGMVFLEAQAAGLPVIGTRSGGIPDAVLEGEGGWLVDQDDDLAVADLCGQLLVDGEEFRKQGEAGRLRVRRASTWENYINELVAVMGCGNA